MSNETDVQAIKTKLEHSKEQWALIAELKTALSSAQTRNEMLANEVTRLEAVVKEVYGENGKLKAQIERLTSPSPCGVIDHTWLDWQPKEGTITAALEFHKDPLNKTIAHCRACQRESRG